MLIFKSLLIRECSYPNLNIKQVSFLFALLCFASPLLSVPESEGSSMLSGCGVKLFITVQL